MVGIRVINCDVDGSQHVCYEGEVGCLDNSPVFCPVFVPDPLLTFACYDGELYDCYTSDPYCFEDSPAYCNTDTLYAAVIVVPDNGSGVFGTIDLIQEPGT